MTRFLRPGWLLLHLSVLAVVVACTALGFWQLRRLEVRQARNLLIEARRDEEPQPLATLLEGTATDALAERRALAVGRWDAEHEVLWQRGTTYGGEPGFAILTPLVLEDGRALLVERGWVPFGYRATPVAEAEPPAGRVLASGTLHPGRQPPTGFWANLAPRNPPGALEITAYPDPERLAQQMPYALLPVYLRLAEQMPDQTEPLPVVLPLEPLGDGPHLGYAIQWFAFALIGGVGYGLLLRRLALTDDRSPAA